MVPSRSSIFFKAVTLIAPIIAFLPVRVANSSARAIQLLNESGHRVEVYWIHPETGEMMLQSSQGGVHNGATFSLNSYVSHAFEVREVPSRRTGECQGENNQCRTAHFAVNENNDQILYLRPGMELEHTDNIRVAEKSAVNLMSECESIAMKEASRPGVNASLVITGLRDCVEESITKKLSDANEEIAFQAKIREDMSNLLENYTCADQALPTSEPQRTEYWYYKGKRYKVDIMHDRDASKIHVVEGFVSEEECTAMEAAAEGKLHKATTANGEGGSHYSDARKAMQAGIVVPWDKEGEGDPIAAMSRRIYDYTNHATDLDLSEHGQENLMSIQYFGRGDDDEAPDRYSPHCDGECKGMPHKEGGRVATMVMYCTVPEKGGATNFMNAGVHVVPIKGNAVFFSYINAETMITDKGFTQHSGCPVTVGSKKIVTQWMRHGVSSETPWTAFNTLGIKFSEANDS